MAVDIAPRPALAGNRHKKILRSWSETAMQLSRRGLFSSAAALSTVPVLRARAQTRLVIKLGVLTDLSGTYRDDTAPTSVAAAQLAMTR
jgi:hypothetical protein